MSKPISNITIVGGGTAGWIVAAYLNHRLQWGLTGQPGVRITLVESPSLPTIGVGEATVPTLKGTLRILEVPEAEFIERTNASFKLGIRFDRWQVGANGKPYSYVHPFTGGSSVRGRNPGYAFQRYGLPGVEGAVGADFIRTISHAWEAIEQFKGPRRIGAQAFDGSLQYAYHIDASLLAQFLKEICLSRGVEYISDEVTEVVLDERGFIASLMLEKRGGWATELVIDCTGFRGLLINDALGEPFLSYSDYLLNDRAIPIQLARGQARRVIPATVATALDAGWSWRIPLHSRDGTGYVFSSSFRSDDAALDAFATFLGQDPATLNPRVVKMRVGRCRRSWVKNCVAVGLASGFVEPLESTAIMSIELAARCLLQYFPSTAFEEPLCRQYNYSMQRFYEEVRDFLCLHFCLSNRDDTPYWRAVRHDMKRSDQLHENLELWRHVLPSVADPRSDMVFGNWSVQSVLFGKGFYGDAGLGGVEVVPETLWRWYWADCRAAKRDTLARLPDHWDLVQSIRESAIAGEARARQPKGMNFPVDDDLLLAATRVMSPNPPTRLQLPGGVPVRENHGGL